MINLQLQYQKLEEQLEYIQTYIQSIELQKNMISEIENQITDQATLNSFPKTIDYSRIIKKVIASPIQYNAVIISIYGYFEQYIDNIFSTYCNELYSIVDTYDNLPDKLKEKHIKKLGDFLTNPQRYKNYDLTNVQAIKNAFYAFENPKTGFTNNQKLILSHSGNLKIEQISELANDLGIPDFEKSIANCYIFKNYQMQHNDYSKENYSNLVARNSKKLFNILEKIVDERNNVAHGWVENRISFSDIDNEYIEYIHYLSKSILEILILSLFNTKYNHGKLYFIGKPIEVYDHHIIGINNKGSLLKKNDYLYAIKDKAKKILRIESLQKDLKDIDEISEYNVDIGIGFTKHCDLNIDKNYEFYCDTIPFH